MRGISGPCALILAAVAMQLFGFSSFAEAQAPAPAPADAKSVDLKEAQGRLAKASSPADYAAMLDSFAAALKPSEALVLLDQGIAQAEGADRKKLLVRAADLDLLVGLFGEAASRYEAAAGGDPVLLLRAARCALAAGDPEKASSLSADVVAAAQDSELAAAARLVGAWSLAMQGRRTDAASVASAIALAPKSGALALSAERRREARFLLWLCADGGEKAAASSTLSAEFPGSPEALIAAGSVSAPPLPHWYLGDLGNFGAAAAGKQPLAAATAPAASPAPGTASPAASPAPSSRNKRLQVGYFSREDNAQGLKDELSSKGFTAKVEARMRMAGSGKGEEKRWIVVVEGGKDIAKTMQSLKDSGYESYIIE